ncbi:MAG: CBS domain-containing protein [Rhodocyclaceae bacterium]|nr:CBS domain-containing protein [Rhodocyclaceae bacterium]
MERESYAPLAQTKIGDANCEVVDAGRTRKVRSDSPAIDVMTDLRLIAAATIAPDTPLPDANQAMILRGVRSLFVVEGGRKLLGLITATDLLGEKPVQLAAQRGISTAELDVRDAMVPLDRVEAVDIDDVTRAEVGHVVATLARAGRQHMIVTERVAGGTLAIRGIFSSSQIARQLGIPMPSGTVASTFAEIEAALSA